MIRVLDKFIADKIAAGEVIERPVSAVKELVENSIDAGAKSIIVEIRGGGRSYIRVTDDGCGIAAEEAETAFLRHATSKISSITDLDNITSLGFRGEALASISAVSRLTLVTRTADNVAGVRLMMHGGQVVSNETVGTNPGTTIVVEELFYNTPARRKFMGSEAREGSAIIDLIEQYAVYYADIRFMMIRNGETVFMTSGSGDRLEAVKTLYPDSAHSDLIEVRGDRVCGYISDPGTTRSNRKGQLFFVNGRLVSSQVIEKGLEKGYSGRIFSGFPVAILFITAEPSDIDVNIHPGKKEIRFLHADDVIREIADAVDTALRTQESAPAVIAPAPVIPAAPERSERSDDRYSYVTPEASGVTETGEQSSIRDYLGSLTREEPAAREETQAEAVTGTQEESAGTGDDADTADALRRVPEIPRAARQFSFDDLVFKGYVFDTYIIMEARDTIYMFDQHAAHERINYERFLSAYIESEQLPQPVLTPITISVSADVYYMGRELLDPLIRMGYDISDFGAGSFIIRGVPSYVTLSEAESFVRTYLEAAGESADRNDVVVDKLILRSCKASVKGGERLSESEINDLIRDLAGCRDPYACPHGRPTFIRFTRYEIERSFRRK